jgi:adenylate cyclase
MERKLAAIVAGDIVGYSRMMAKDEDATYSSVRAAFDEVICPAILRHGGRMFKNTGDGFLATFPSVNKALDASIEIQSALEERPLDMRIGINLGDVIEEADDMFGDGVNVASRLESLATPGGILVSAAVARGADRKREASFTRLGHRYVKTIPEAIEVYAVRLRKSASARSAILATLGRGRKALPYALGTAAAAIAAILVLDGGRWAETATNMAQRFVQMTQPEGPPAIAVLPFDNMSGDSGQNYFVDGLTEDVIASLARNPDIQVIARNSTFAVRGQATDLRDLGRQLGARYIVEGSARRSGNQLRVVAQLIDTRDGTHLWSRSFDRQLDDIFALQTALTTEIVSHVASYVRQSEIAQTAERPTDSLQAYDLVLQARSRYRHGTSDPDGLLAARGMLQRALEMDPAYAAARAYLGMTHVVEATWDQTGKVDRAKVEQGLSEARQAIALDPNLAVGYQVLSYGLAVSADFAAAIKAAEKAVELNPNEPDSLMALAKAQVRFNAYDEAVANAEKARRLHPVAPEYYTYVHGQALYAAQRLDEADAVLMDCLMRAPQQPDCLLIRTAIMVENGDIEEARGMMARLVAAKPDFSLAAEAQYNRFGSSPLMERFLASLRQAKAPETADAAVARQA